MLMDFIWIVILMVIDQLSKFVIAADPAKFSNLEIIPGFFYLTYVKNTGAAWSMLAGQRVLLSAVAALAIVFMTVALKRARKKGNRLLCLALVLMISGAAGNLADRLLFGYVRDFLHFYPLGYDFPVFNFADMCLCVGVGILILSTILEKEEDEDEDEEEEEEPLLPKRRLTGKEQVIEPEVIEPEKDRTGVD